MAPVCILRIRLMVDDWTGEYPIYDRISENWLNSRWLCWI